MVNADNQQRPLDKAHITLTIPEEFTQDFLGVMALDTLHDAKGYGYLAGHKLHKLTDLLAESIFFHNSEITDRRFIQNYIFGKVLGYFVELWAGRLSALALDGIPLDTPIEQLREIAVLPIRSVANREDEDTFVSLGKGKSGVEVQNYFDQRNKLTGNDTEGLSFISPKGIYHSGDYFRQAMGVVDIIGHRTNGEAKVSLDMKSSAGLIRTLTDPIGYITGLPTYADPGYNMPGMSAIRQYAEVTFINPPQNGAYGGPYEFKYTIQLATTLQEEPLCLYSTEYFYGTGLDGLNRGNVLISILGEAYNSSLPRSMAMASALGDYLNPSPKDYNTTVFEVLKDLRDVIWTHYENYTDLPPFKNNIIGLYTQLNWQSLNSKSLRGLLPNSKNGRSLVRWCKAKNSLFRYTYILNTLQNLHYFNVKEYIHRSKDLLPKHLITVLLPEMMTDYNNKGQNLTLLAFCYYQIYTLQSYISKEGNGVPYQEKLDRLLKQQWLPKRRGKLVNQIEREHKRWSELQSLKLQQYKPYLFSYFQELTTACKQNMQSLLALDSEPEATEDFLQGLPLFKPTLGLESVLTEELYLNYPEMFCRTNSINRTGLLLATLLRSAYLPDLDLNLQSLFTTSIHSDATYDALRTMLGKFSGDFGQIMWCICYGHIFASEDNNTSAMALLLHRIPKECFSTYYPSEMITTPPYKKWVNIHGLGDGNCVDVTIDVK